MPESVRVLLCTAPPDRAEGIAEGLLQRRLAACVNVIGGVVSRYWWQDKLERDEESLLIIKCEADRVDEIVAALADLHPYEVPELLSLPVEKGNPAYLEWVRRESSAR